MKITKEEPKFNPITVVFETKAEISLFVAWLGITTIEVYKAFGVDDSVSKKYWDFEQYHSSLELRNIELLQGE